MKFYIGTHATFKVNSNVEVTYVNPTVSHIFKLHPKFFAQHKYYAANYHHTVGRLSKLYIASNPIKTSGVSGSETFVMSHLRFAERLNVNEIDADKLDNLLKNFHQILVTAPCVKAEIHQFEEI